MKKIKSVFFGIWNYFSVWERALWILSVVLIVATFFAFDGAGYLTLIASLIGVTSLILCAKGNPLGQGLMIIFSVIYGTISFECGYYGEMTTYVCMTLPMSIASLVSWIRNPYEKGRAEVRVERLEWWDAPLLSVLTILITVAFYFTLGLLGTANLLPSTISVATSFIAVYLTFRRSPYFALAYAANDVVLILLWILMAVNAPSYISVITCFVVFLVNDLYGFFSWLKMAKKQDERGI